METKISDIMTGKKKEIISVTPDTTVFDAIRLMADKNIGAVLVIEGDRLEGIFTEREYTRRVILKGLSSKETQIKDAMLPQAAHITPAASVREGLSLMSKNNCRYLPVFDNEKLVGVISIGELAEQLIKDLETTVNQLNEYIAGHWESQ